MRVGDLVRLKKGLNFSPDGRNLLGIIVEMHKLATTSAKHRGVKREFLGIEYKVRIITNNKAAWYIEDSLELVSEGWRFGKK